MCVRRIVLSFAVYSVVSPYGLSQSATISEARSYLSTTPDNNGINEYLEVWAAVQDYPSDVCSV